MEARRKDTDYLTDGTAKPPEKSTIDFGASVAHPFAFSVSSMGVVVFERIEETQEFHLVGV